MREEVVEPGLYELPLSEFPGADEDLRDSVAGRSHLVDEYVREMLPNVEPVPSHDELPSLEMFMGEWHKVGIGEGRLLIYVGREERMSI